MTGISKFIKFVNKKVDFIMSILTVFLLGVSLTFVLLKLDYNIGNFPINVFLGILVALSIFFLVIFIYLAILKTAEKIYKDNQKEALKILEKTLIVKNYRLLVYSPEKNLSLYAKFDEEKNVKFMLTDINGKRLKSDKTSNYVEFLEYYFNL